MTSDYYKNLPKKRMAAGALILNNKGEMLIVKPSYKNHWSIAGGAIEGNESPRAGCFREIKEEIGLELKNLIFLGVDYMPENGERTESLQFIFLGGKLSESQIKNIKIDGKEIVEYRFMKIDEALPLFSENMRRRMPKCLEALKNNTSIYLENGR